MNPSNAEIEIQIAEEGKPWEIVPMTSAFGEVLAAEEIPCIIPIARDIAVIEEVKRDITSVSSEFTFSMLLNSRLDVAKRKVALSKEIEHYAKIKMEEEKKSDLKRDMNDYMKFATSKRRIYGGSR